MFKIQWDKETGGVKLDSLVTKDTLSIAPRPVFYEELHLLGLNALGWKYPECDDYRMVMHRLESKPLCCGSPWER